MEVLGLGIKDPRETASIDKTERKGGPMLPYSALAMDGGSVLPCFVEGISQVSAGRASEGKMPKLGKQSVRLS